MLDYFQTVPKPRFTDDQGHQITLVVDVLLETTNAAIVPKKTITHASMTSETNLNAVIAIVTARPLHEVALVVGIAIEHVTIEVLLSTVVQGADRGRLAAMAVETFDTEAQALAPVQWMKKQTCPYPEEIRAMCLTQRFLCLIMLTGT